MAVPYAGDRPATATIIGVEIVREPKHQVGFAVHPRCWVVERFFAWISCNRRLWEDLEATLASAKALLYAASVVTLVRRLERPNDYRDGLLLEHVRGAKRLDSSASA